MGKVRLSWHGWARCEMGLARSRFLQRKLQMTSHQSVSITLISSRSSSPHTFKKWEFSPSDFTLPTHPRPPSHQIYPRSLLLIIFHIVASRTTLLLTQSLTAMISSHVLRLLNVRTSVFMYMRMPLKKSWWLFWAKLAQLTDTFWLQVSRVQNCKYFTIVSNILEDDAIKRPSNFWDHSQQIIFKPAIIR